MYLKKAFDTVDHATLLNKLNKLGIQGTEPCWFDSYLTDREQCVQHGCNNSDFLPIIYSVPQGSILDPSLFNNVTSHSMQMTPYYCLHIKI